MHLPLTDVGGRGGQNDPLDIVDKDFLQFSSKLLKIVANFFGEGSAENGPSFFERCIIEKQFCT